jgi:hypothetical protein
MIYLCGILNRKRVEKGSKWEKLNFIIIWKKNAEMG